MLDLTLVALLISISKDMFFFLVLKALSETQVSYFVTLLEKFLRRVSNRIWSQGQVDNISLFTCVLCFRSLSIVPLNSFPFFEVTDDWTLLCFPFVCRAFNFLPWLIVIFLLPWWRMVFNIKTKEPKGHFPKHTLHVVLFLAVTRNPFNLFNTQIFTKTAVFNHSIRQVK